MNRRCICQNINYSPSHDVTPETPLCKFSWIDILLLHKKFNFDNNPCFFQYELLPVTSSLTLYHEGNFGMNYNKFRSNGDILNLSTLATNCMLNQQYKIIELEKEFEELKKMIYYLPPGPGYLSAKFSFEKHNRSNSL